MKIKKLIRDILRKSGVDLVGFDPRFNSTARKIKLLQRYQECTLLDVGANVGQFAIWVREAGWKGDIHSFEPGADAFEQLSSKSSSSSIWHAHHLALGEASHQTSMKISADSFSSSLLSPTDANITAHEGVRTQSEETIEMSTMDDFVGKHCPSAPAMVVKVDTQGYEDQVLSGAGDTLEKTPLLILELSLKELYSGQRLFHELLPDLAKKGFYPTIIEPCDENYQNLEILQVDGWFINRNLLK